MNALHAKIVAHLAESPKNELLLAGEKLVFLKSETIETMVSEEETVLVNCVRINGTRYTEAQVRFWQA